VSSCEGTEVCELNTKAWQGLHGRSIILRYKTQRRISARYNNMVRDLHYSRIYLTY